MKRAIKITLINNNTVIGYGVYNDITYLSANMKQLHPLEIPDILCPDKHAYIKSKRIIIRPKSINNGNPVYEAKNGIWVKL